MRRRRSPQEKKALSYAKDRRNDFGENDKASRRVVPLRKRAVNRANRLREGLALGTVGTKPDAGLAEGAESRLLARRGKRWRKTPDLPLGQHVARRLERRAAAGSRGEHA